MDLAEVIAVVAAVDLVADVEVAAEEAALAAVVVDEVSNSTGSIAIYNTECSIHFYVVIYICRRSPRRKGWWSRRWARWRWHEGWQESCC